MTNVISIAHLLPSAAAIQERRAAEEHDRQAVKKERQKVSKRAHKGLRRASLINRTPAWADMAAIKKIYAQCVKKTEKTGIEYHVDHIIPLQGKYVSGLHVANNLRIIPAADNLKKYNKWNGR